MTGEPSQNFAHAAEARLIAAMIGAEVKQIYPLGAEFRFKDGKTQCLHHRTPIWQWLASRRQGDVHD